FQAEDGIRDASVTGVQTCALPIFSTNRPEARKYQAAFRRELNLPERYFLASGRFVEKKNLLTLLRAYASYRELAGRLEGLSPWDLVLLGAGPLRETLSSQLSTLNLRRHVLLPGFIQYRKLPAYYALADAFVHASVPEQWGLVVNEAMATGLPVIVSNRCGCVPDLVAEGKNGFTFDPASVKNLGRLMVNVSRLSDRRLEEMGGESRRIVAGFTPAHFDTVVQRAIDVAKATPICRATLFSWLRLKPLVRR